jgi:hypothetical protein
MTDQKVEYLLGFGARRGVAHEQGDYRVFPISGERLTSLRRLPLAIDATDSPVELRGPPHWPNSGHQTLSGVGFSTAATTKTPPSRLNALVRCGGG